MFFTVLGEQNEELAELFDAFAICSNFHFSASSVSPSFLFYFFDIYIWFLKSQPREKGIFNG